MLDPEPKVKRPRGRPKRMRRSPASLWPRDQALLKQWLEWQALHVDSALEQAKEWKKVNKGENGTDAHVAYWTAARAFLKWLTPRVAYKLPWVTAVPDGPPEIEWMEGLQ
jgi:glutathione S-transferase